MNRLNTFGFASLLTGAFSLLILCGGCSSEPAKTEIDRNRATKPQLEENDDGDSVVPEVREAASASFE